MYKRQILIVVITITIGIIITNSTSKIRKITAIMKKCLEKGIRDDSKGSNPHSNGDDFSRSIIDLVDTKYKKVIKVDVYKRQIYTVFNLFIAVEFLLEKQYIVCKCQI